MALASPPPDQDEDDDEIEPVPFWRRPRVLLLGGAGILVLAFIFTRGKAPPKPDELAKKDAYIGVVVPYAPLTQTEPAPTPPPEPAKAPVVAAQAAPPPAPAPQPAPAMPPQAPAFRMPMPMPPGVAPKPTRPIMLSYAVHVEPAKPPPEPAEPPQTGLAFKAATIPGTKASPAIDDTYQLMPGLLPCVLDTAIESDLPGPILCHLPGAVYSPKGVLLMEAGTQVIGKYETMGKTGSNRLMAVSTFAHTPNGIWIPLTGEPMADDLGRTGLDGAVDRHFFRKFGSAIILTLTQSALSIVQAAASSGGNTYLQLNSGGGGGGVGGLAQQMLQEQVNLADTFSKNQGDTIALFIDEPIEFSDSYKIRQVRTQ